VVGQAGVIAPEEWRIRGGVFRLSGHIGRGRGGTLSRRELIRALENGLTVVEDTAAPQAQPQQQQQQPQQQQQQQQQPQQQQQQQQQQQEEEVEEGEVGGGGGGADELVVMVFFLLNLSLLFFFDTNMTFSFAVLRRFQVPSSTSIQQTLFMNQRQRLGYNEVVAKSMITALTKNK
jgi:hypothetical protein